MATTIPAGTLRLLLTSIGYRAKARKRDAARAANGSAPPAAPVDGLPRLVEGARLTRRQISSRRAGMVCDVLHSYIHYYNRAAALTCTASRRGVGVWYVLEALRRCDTLQCGTGGIIAACFGLISWAVERAQSQEKRLQSLVRCFAAWTV